MARETPQRERLASIDLCSEWPSIVQTSIFVLEGKLTRWQMGIESKDIGDKQHQPPVPSVDDDR
eukprot:768141-Hanusia_phi.AAC.4